MITAIVLLAAPAGGAGAGPRQAEWFRLFEEGRLLSEANDWEAACPKFAKSFALDGTRGGTVANLAVCQEKFGTLPRAWRLWIDAVQLYRKAKNRVGEQFARENAARVAAAATTVVIAVPEPETAGLAITVNGEPVAPAAEIQYVVMPGEIEVVATANGRERFTFSREAGAGETVAVALTLARTESTITARDDAPAITIRRRSRVRWAIGTAIAGGAALGGGLVLAVVGKQRYDDVANDLAFCNPGDPPACNDAGKAKIADAQRLADVGTGFAIAGGVLAVTSAILYVTAPRDRVVTPIVTPTSVGVAVRF